MKKRHDLNNGYYATVKDGRIEIDSDTLKGGFISTGRRYSDDQIKEILTLFTHKKSIWQKIKDACKGDK